MKKQTTNRSDSVTVEVTPDRSGRTKIANEADVGFGSFYNHFSSKEEIAGAVFELQSEKFAAVIDVVKAQTADPALVISYVQRLIIRKARVDPVWGWFIVRAQGALPQMHKTFGERAAMTLKRGTIEKRFNLKALDTAIAITLGSLIGVIKNMLQGELPVSVESEFVELMLRMYGVDLEEATLLSRRPLPPEILAALTEE